MTDHTLPKEIRDDFRALRVAGNWATSSERESTLSDLEGRVRDAIQAERAKVAEAREEREDIGMLLIEKGLRLERDHDGSWSLVKHP